MSLVEIVVVIAVLGTLAVFVAPVLVRALGAYDAMDRSVETYGKMRYAMERLARELREVRRDPGNAANYHFTAMGAAGASFFKGDGTEVTIGSGGGAVTLGYAGTGSGTLTDRVGAFTLAYFQSDGVTAATGAGDVAFVEISLTLTDGTTSYANRVRVHLKNAS
jgi:hypothetical protein